MEGFCRIVLTSHDVSKRLGDFDMEVVIDSGLKGMLGHLGKTNKPFKLPFDDNTCV